MNCSLHRATPAEIDHFIEEPDALDSFLDAYSGPAPAVRTIKPKGLAGLLLRLFPITITETIPEPIDKANPEPPSDPERMIDIEKGWHGLHFLFTGTAEEGEEPACFLVRGGETLDDEGYARALRPEDVRRFDNYLRSLSSEDLRQRYDAERMAKLKIYPEAIWRRASKDTESPVEWLLDCFDEVKSFIDKAAAAGDGVVVHIA
jgi:hypothetical protein